MLSAETACQALKSRTNQYKNFDLMISYDTCIDI